MRTLIPYIVKFRDLSFKNYCFLILIKIIQKTNFPVSLCNTLARREDLRNRCLKTFFYFMKNNTPLIRVAAAYSNCCSLLRASRYHHLHYHYKIYHQKWFTFKPLLEKCTNLLPRKTICKEKFWSTLRCENFTEIGILIFSFFLKFPGDNFYLPKPYQGFRRNQFSRLLSGESTPGQLFRIHNDISKFSTLYYWRQK